MSNDPLLTWLEHLPVPAYLFEVTADDFLLRFANGLVRAAHPEITAIYGYPMVGLYRDQPEVIADARRAVTEGAPVTREMPVRRFDRLEANQRLRLTYVPVSDTQLVIYTIDVAPPSMAEAALRESEERYRGLVTAMPDGVVLRDKAGAVLTANDAAARIFGQPSPGSLVGKTRLAPEDWEILDETGTTLANESLPSHRAVTGDGAPTETLVGLRRPSGSVRWVRVSVVRVGDGVVSTYSDVTDRVEAQRAMHASTERLARALEAARMGTFEWDPTTDQGQWSPNLESLFHTPTDLFGLLGFAKAVHPDDRLRLLDAARKITEAPVDGTVVQVDFRLQGTDGVTRWAEAGARVSVGANGAMRVVGTLKDVTDERRLEEELRRAHRLESVGRLAGGIAHDFNNLLAAMLGALELVEDVASPETHDDLSTIRQGAERARDLTKQLLVFARRQPIELKVLEINTLVSQVERLLRRLVGADIDLVVALGPRMNVRADAAQLEQVLVNLVVNARDAMPRGGRIGVTVEQTTVAPGGDVAEGTYAVLEVSDTGSGMDEETVRRIFDPFFTTKELGTGLGLASSYGIVESHGGKVSVSSVVGKGTTFRVLIPCVTEAPAPLPSARERPTPSAPARILLIEDEELVRATTKRLLERLGYQVLEASGADEALALAAAGTTTFDAVLCDVAMPGRSGPEVVAELRTSRPGLRVLFVSGYPEGEIGASEHAAFLTKPYSLADLADTLRALFESNADAPG